MVTVRRGEQRGRDDDPAPSWCGSSTPATTSSFERGTFRVRGDTVEIFPAYEEQAIRIELWGDEVERISKINPLTGETIAQLEQCADLSGQALRHRAAQRSSARCRPIRAELAERLAELQGGGQAARGAAARVAHQLRHRDAARDRHLRRHRELLAPPDAAAAPGERPACLFDYFPADFLVVVDESHVTLPQIGGMFNGDRARKLTLVEYGFRLPVGARQPAAPVRRVHGAGARR